ncbi:glucagon-like peptide 1 receptor isoform X2 [Pristis pectinata]|nr:glucagon-like peptide 1 receptor isoform X2 [Pristis pectinata]XP_051876991.1 glucagon-like peptide 1 receptor isoform X2 [Pristis pectinata]XP_051876992.1 glucagon-like peptide 1 receptor isoform X2 [Pristis pectinata]
MHVCWPDGLPGTWVNVSCPWYIPWIDRVGNGSAFRYCTQTGSWLMDNVTNQPWVDHSACDEDDAFLRQQVLKRRVLSSFRWVYTAGYSLSLLSLLGASLILISFRKLHCTRNYIHLNLFAAFTLRAAAVLLKDSFTDRLQSDPPEPRVGGSLTHVLACRAAQVFLHYSVACTYHWLLVEGLFLYVLLVVSVFSEQKSFRAYLLIGWGVPLLFISPWITVKYLLENSGCWRQNKNMSFWWIVRSPLLLIITINFVIFTRIMILLISKMRSHQAHDAAWRNRLTKSTLILIPLLGVHEILFAFVTDENAEGTLRYIKLFVELFFGSIQGMLVAVLYCFINGEVQHELRKKLQRWRTKKNLRKSHHRNGSGQREKVDSTEQDVEMGTRDDLESPNTDEGLLNTLSSHQGLNSEIMELPHQAPELILNPST